MDGGVVANVQAEREAANKRRVAIQQLLHKMRMTKANAAPMIAAYHQISKRPHVKEGRFAAAEVRIFLVLS
jgi:hypothetical protein